MTISAWYMDWVTRHAKLFNLGPEWVESAEGWWRVLSSLGATAERLEAATELVQTGPRLWKQGDHLPAIRAALGEVIDREAVARRRVASESVSACPECDGTGSIIVPLPRDIRPDQHGELRWWYCNHHKSGEPNYRCGAVTCHCTAARSPGQMSIGQYEREIFPNWRQALQWVERDRRLRHVAVMEARDVSKLPARLAAAMGLSQTS